MQTGKRECISLQQTKKKKKKRPVFVEPTTTGLRKSHLGLIDHICFSIKIAVSLRLVAAQSE